MPSAVWVEKTVVAAGGDGLVPERDGIRDDDAAGIRAFDPDIPIAFTRERLTDGRTDKKLMKTMKEIESVLIRVL